MPSRILFVPVGIFYGLSAVVYLASLVAIPGLEATYFVSQILSALLLIPLFMWLRSRPARPSPSNENPPSLGMVILTIGGLFLLVMAVRIPAVAFLAFPLEKAPLIYLIVLMAVLVERRPVSVYGFNLDRGGRQLILGILLLLGAIILPYAAIATGLVFLFGVNLLAGYNFAAVFLALPFQVFAVGISEEGFFRGYMQTKLNKVTGIRRAILFQAILFGLWHFVWHINPLDLVGMALHISSTFVFGLLTGSYFRYSGSIAGVALFHGLSNSLGEGLSPAVPGLPFSADILLAVSALAELIVAVLLILLAGRIARALRIWPKVQ